MSAALKAICAAYTAEAAARAARSRGTSALNRASGDDWDGGLRYRPGYAVRDSDASTHKLLRWFGYDRGRIITIAGVDPRVIRTDYDPPPIPTRNCDWCAWRDDIGEEWGCAYGSTEAEAVAELMALIEERE